MASIGRIVEFAVSAVRQDARQRAPEHEAVIRRRLRVGAADDAAEREADQVAQAISAAATAGLLSPTTSRIRRGPPQCAPEDGTVVRRQLRVGAADDAAEREADQVARAISAGDRAAVQTPASRIRPRPADVIRRYWEVDWATKSAVWRGDGSWAADPGTTKLMFDEFVLVDVRGNTLYDPRAGIKKQTGGGGFALTSGTNTQATFNMFANPVTIGGPLGATGPQETIDYGLFSVSHQGGGWQPQQFAASKPAGNVVPAPQNLPGLPSGVTSSFVTPDVTSQFTGVREDRGRFPPQKKAMFNMSAAEANQWAGQDIPPGQWDWLHRHRFQHGGIDQVQPNVPENFVAGTHGANIRHLMLENAVSYSSENYGVIPTSTNLTDVLSEEHHVAGGMDYTTHSAMDIDVSMTAPIDLRDPMMPRRADQGYANLSQETFQQWAVTHQMIQQGVMTPDDLGPEGAAAYRQFVANFTRI